MNDPKIEETEVIEEEGLPVAEEPEAVEEPEPEIPDEELISAIEEELTDDSADDAQPETPAEPEAEKEDDEPETPDSDDKAEPEPEPEPEPKAEDAKPSDEFGTLEEGTPERTRERFEAVKSKYDEVITERDTIRAENEQWRETIQGTGTNPEQFGMMLTFLGKVNSGKPEDLREAYELISGELNAIGKMLGKPTMDSSPLDDHQDLKERVDNGDLSEQDAYEIVEARAARNLNETNSRSQAEEQRRTEVVTSALKDIEQLGHQLQSTDPHFKQKMELLAPIVEGIIQSAPNAPETWKSTIMAAYQKIPVIPMGQPTPPKPTAPDSIRPGNASPSNTTMDKEPGSAIEAIDLALQRGY